MLERFSKPSNVNGIMALNKSSRYRTDLNLPLHNNQTFQKNVQRRSNCTVSKTRTNGRIILERKYVCPKKVPLGIEQIFHLKKFWTEFVNFLGHNLCFLDRLFCPKKIKFCFRVLKDGLEDDNLQVIGKEVRTNWFGSKKKKSTNWFEVLYIEVTQTSLISELSKFDCCLYLQVLSSHNSDQLSSLASY